MKLGHAFKNAFGVRPSPGAAIVAPDYVGKQRGTFFPASIAVAGDGHTPYFEGTPCQFFLVNQFAGLLGRFGLKCQP
jgi:hypothetical protein